MTTLKLFDRFAKGKANEVTKKYTCVIYTRVSTKEQAENNMSLDIQRRACEQFAQNHGYKIMAYFGGTYESAKTDERIEFTNMLSFVEKSREPIHYIVVYSIDRFSRSGGNAIYITEQLKKKGITVLSVTQPTDVTTPSGILQQNIQFIFSEYDNQLRREKSIAGMRNKLLMGEWCTKPPMGYDKIAVNGMRSIVVNEKGALIRKAFVWKYYERVTQNEIRLRLKAMGLNISGSNLSRVFQNPFYCGILVNKMLEGKVVKGKHEKIISKELFLAVNSLRTSTQVNQKHYKDIAQLPLKGILFCDKCKAKMTGYCIKKKNLFYYKCATIGCCSNISAITLHSMLLKIFIEIRVENENRASIKEIFEDNFMKIEKVNHVSSHRYKLSLASTKKKIEQLEEQYVFGKLNENLYKKHLAKLFQEQSEIEIRLDKVKAGLIPLNSTKEEMEKIINDFPAAWQSGNLNTKRIIQSIFFNGGIYYSKEKNILRIADNIS